MPEKLINCEKQKRLSGSFSGNEMSSSSITLPDCCVCETKNHSIDSSNMKKRFHFSHVTDSERFTYRFPSLTHPQHTRYTFSAPLPIQIFNNVFVIVDAGKDFFKPKIKGKLPPLKPFLNSEQQQHQHQPSSSSSQYPKTPSRGKRCKKKNVIS